MKKIVILIMAVMVSAAGMAQSVDDRFEQANDAYNEGFLVRGNFDIFRAYYDMACRLIAKIFGHFAWYNTLTFFEYE